MKAEMSALSWRALSPKVLSRKLPGLVRAHVCFGRTEKKSLHAEARRTRVRGRRALSPKVLSRKSLGHRALSRKVLSRKLSGRKALKC